MGKRFLLSISNNLPGHNYYFHLTFLPLHNPEESPLICFCLLGFSLADLPYFLAKIFPSCDNTRERNYCKTKYECFCTKLKSLKDKKLSKSQKLYMQFSVFCTIGLTQNKPKMAYSRDLPKMARQNCDIMD